MATKLHLFICFVIIIGTPPQLRAFDWSINELYYKYGKLDTPSFAGGGSAHTHISGLQHASGWKYGDNFLFVDYLNDDDSDSFNDSDWYGELYLNFSLGKISQRDLRIGPVRDIGILFGVNAGGDSKVLKYLPGLRISWALPGFTFLNTDIFAYIDDNAGLDDGGAPAEDNTYFIDINGAYPVVIGEHVFSIEGHIEYLGESTNELGLERSDWLLSQIQFRYDLGKQLLDNKDHLYVGIEWEYWINKLGDEKTDENAVQALVVWRF